MLVLTISRNYLARLNLHYGVLEEYFLFIPFFFNSVFPSALLDDMLAAEEWPRCMIIAKTVTPRCTAMANYMYTYNLINKKQSFSATGKLVSQLSVSTRIIVTYELSPNIHPSIQNKNKK